MFCDYISERGGKGGLGQQESLMIALAATI